MYKSLNFPQSVWWVLLTFFLLMTTFGVQANSLGKSDESANPSSQSRNFSDLTPIRLQLNWSHQFEFAGFYAALEKGFYKEVGLDVHLQDWQSGLNVNQAVLNDEADLGIGYSNILVEYAKGQPVQLLFPVFQVSPAVSVSIWTRT